jgi:glycolate oxidase
MMNMNINEIQRRLVKILGEDKVSTDPVTLSLYASDPVSFPMIPEDLSKKFVVVMPSNIEEITEVVKLASRENVPIIPQGASTSLALGSSVISLSALNQLETLKYGIIMFTGSMRRILEFSKTDRYIKTEAGVRIDELNDYLDNNDTGLFFPVDPASSRAATVGGAVASGAGGLRGARYGTMREWVLGLEFVDGLGRIHRVGCRTVKCRQGYDLTRLLVGSEGTLGVIYSAILKLWPKPHHILRTLFYSERFIEGFKTFLDIRERFGVPLIAEYLSNRLVEKIRETTGIWFGDGHAIITDIEIEDLSLVDKFSKEIESILARNNIKSYVIASNRDPDFEKIYFLRKSMYPSALKTRKMKYIITEDIVVPITKIPEYVEFVETLRRRYERDIEVGGHLGDGNLHPKLEGDLDDPRDRDLVMKIGREIALKAVELGGSVSAEHGIGTMKIDLLIEEFRYRGSEASIDLMREIKKTFDPKNILNPGRVIPIER